MGKIILESKLDNTDREILQLLLKDGRMSFAEIGRQVGLSLPAAKERVRRLEDAGIIEGYSTKINLKKLGYPTTVFVELTIPPGRYEAVKAKLESIPEVLEAHHVAGDTSFMIELRLADLEDLEPILLQLNQQGHSSSTIVLSTTVKKDGSDLI
ncbi:MAG: Lrp/AsnC family transcriptional regulator [Chloroflexota bacterium]